MRKDSNSLQSQFNRWRQPRGGTILYMLRKWDGGFPDLIDMKGMFRVEVAEGKTRGKEGVRKDITWAVRLWTCIVSENRFVCFLHWKFCALEDGSCN